MRRFFLLIIFLVSSEISLSQNLTSIDSPAVRLLPEKMSILEKGLWGEKGLFRRLGLAPLTLEARERELKLRRTMLTLHQIGGFVTFGLMAVSVYYGQQVFNGKYEYLDRHRFFTRATFISYNLTAFLSVFSPPPLIRHQRETSTITIHKTLAWLHFAGMIITPTIGLSIKKISDPEARTRRRRYHQISAYFTFITFTTAMIVITF